MNNEGVMMHLQVLCEYMFACFVIIVTAEVEWMDECYVHTRLEPKH